MTGQERLLKKVKHIKQKYGLSPEEYLNLLESQNYKCAICGKSEEELNRSLNHYQSLILDYDNKSGKLRGLLCYPCNTGLSKFKDDIEILSRAIKYLVK